MGLFAWIKLFMPLLVDYIKEVFFPGPDSKKTTPLERVSILLVIILVALLLFIGDNFFKLYGETQTLKMDVVTRDLRIASQAKEIATLTKSVVQLEGNGFYSPTKPVTYDTSLQDTLADKEAQAIAVEQRSRMIDYVNEAP